MGFSGTRKTNYMFLAGIISHGLKECGQRGVPGVYTVSIYLFLTFFSSSENWFESKFKTKNRFKTENNIKFTLFSFF